MKKIGITTTVPIEIIYASGNVPLDLNNIFVTDERPSKFIERAEMDGYPRSVCSWIKGIYGVVLEKNNINTLIGVTEGDCSNTHALMETLKVNGVDVIPFSYPYDRNRKSIENEFQKLMEYFNVDFDKVNHTKKRLDEIRKDIVRLDDLTWKDNKATGFENHLFQVMSSDFNQNPEQFQRELLTTISEIEKRESSPRKLRIAFIGVPPIYTDFYSYLEEIGARVVFNEVQRQFAMPYLEEDIIDQYLKYTYPYDIFFRIEDIKKEIEKREIDAVIHYTQSFCYRQIEDIIVRKAIRKPILTIEGESPGRLDARTKMRIEAFIEMLH